MFVEMTVRVQVADGQHFIDVAEQVTDTLWAKPIRNLLGIKNVALADAKEVETI